MRFAEPKLFRLYGNEKILRENPYRITYKAGIWTMKGTLQRGEVGGTFKNWLVKRRKPTISHLLKSSTPPPGELEGARVRGDLIEFAASLESNSTHPVAKAVVALAGNTKLLKKNNIEYPAEIDKLVDIIVTISIDDKYVG